MNRKHFIEKYTRHSNTGLSLPDDKWIEWVLQHQGDAGANNENGWGFGRVTHYSWYVGDQLIETPAKGGKETWEVLPDASGFICFEDDWKPDNCLLLDVYGKERMRLTVPWQFTRPRNPESARPPTSFARVNEPCINPADGTEGQFGLNAWVEHAGTYYFELNYHTGQFLWGKEIRD
jgi:hypothetical protein